MKFKSILFFSLCSVSSTMFGMKMITIPSEPGLSRAFKENRIDRLYRYPIDAMAGKEVTPRGLNTIIDDLLEKNEDACREHIANMEDRRELYRKRLYRALTSKIQNDH